MNLAKVALYLEYIAFCLRREFAPHTLGEPMSSKKPTGTDPGFLEPPKERQKPAPMDDALRLAAKIDRLMDRMPAWAKTWAVEYMVAKHLRTAAKPPDQFDANS